MQGDEYNYQSDEQFTDKAWTNMRELLDKEMPVQKKKRRGFIWFFLLLGIGLGGAVLTFFPKLADTPIAKERQLNSSKELEKTPFTDNQEKNNYENNLSDEQAGNTNSGLINEEKEALGNSKNDNEQIIERKKEQEESPILANNSSSNFSKKQYNYENNFSVKNENEYFSNSSSNDLELKNENSIVHNNEITSSIDFQKTFKVGSLSPSFFTLKLKDEKEILTEKELWKSEDQPVVESLESPKRKIEYGMYAGTLLDFSNNKFGGFGGGSVHFPLGKKMGIQTGIGYAMLPKKLNYYFSSTQEASILDPSSIITAGQEMAVVESQTKFILARMHYLEMPLLLTYAPHKKLQFQLGVNGSYLLKDQLNVTSDEIGLDEDATHNYGYELNDLDARSFSTEPYKEEFFWKRWNVSSLVGVAWKPTSKWSIGVQYHHGWVKFFKTNEEGIRSGVFDPSGGYSLYNDPVVETASLGQIFDNSISKNKDYNRSVRLSIGYNF